MRYSVKMRYAKTSENSWIKDINDKTSYPLPMLNHFHYKIKQTSFRGGFAGDPIQNFN